MSIQAKGYNYGFVEYDDPGAAERAMQTLNGRRVHQSVRKSTSTLLLRGSLLTFCIGDPRQLGLPIQHVNQGGHFEPLPHLCRRSVE